MTSAVQTYFTLFVLIHTGSTAPSYVALSQQIFQQFIAQTIHQYEWLSLFIQMLYLPVHRRVTKMAHGQASIGFCSNICKNFVFAHGYCHESFLFGIHHVLSFLNTVALHVIYTPPKLYLRRYIYVTL